MKKNIILFMFIIFSVFVFFSCGGGGGGGGSGVAGESSGQYKAVYTSTDAANGYFNINGGQYKTITFSGSQTSGTVTLSDGTGANLTGTYSTDESSNTTASALQARATDSTVFKGAFYIKFNGVAVGYTWQVKIEENMIIIRGQRTDGTSVFYTGGNSANSIIPGSAGDPFNGTSWGYDFGSTYTSSTVALAFNGGQISGPTVDSFDSIKGTDFAVDNISYKSIIAPKGKNYIVCKVDGGYKAYFQYYEANHNYTNAKVWAVGYYTFLIESANSQTCTSGIEVHAWDNKSNEVAESFDLIKYKKLSSN